MKLYAHMVTKRYFDYGSPLGVAVGLAWSSSGKAQDASGFEEGDFASLLASKRAGLPPTWSIEVGEPVRRGVDMNPHGLM